MKVELPDYGFTVTGEKTRGGFQKTVIAPQCNYAGCMERNGGNDGGFPFFPCVFPLSLYLPLSRVPRDCPLFELNEFAIAEPIMCRATLQPHRIQPSRKILLLASSSTTTHTHTYPAKCENCQHLSR